MLVEVRAFADGDSQMVAQCGNYNDAMTALEDYFMNLHGCTRRQAIKRAINGSIDPNRKVYIVKKSTDPEKVLIMSIEIKE